MMQPADVLAFLLCWVVGALIYAIVPQEPTHRILNAILVGLGIALVTILLYQHADAFLFGSAISFLGFP